MQPSVVPLLLGLRAERRRSGRQSVVQEYPLESVSTPSQIDFAF